MKNLAGAPDADNTIREELDLANIPTENVAINDGEVRYSVIGKIGKWVLKRAWYYWIVTTENTEDGLPINLALELHNKKHPLRNDLHLGDIVRCGGHAGALSPDEYGADPVYDEDLNLRLKKLGYKEETVTLGKKEFTHIPITVSEISKLCNEGKLDVERYVSCYHVDDQVGLNELANFLKLNS